MREPMSNAANYGQDAPTVVRNLAAAGALSVSIAVVVRLLDAGPPLSRLAFLLWPGVAWLATAVWMIIGSRVVKLRARDRLVRDLGLKGDERVLDVGCGRGLLLHGVAKALTTGRAVGLDLWRSVDQSGNDPAVTKQNALAEGTSERIEILTGDMTKMELPDTSFDVVVSSWAIHNVPSAGGRSQALREITRVLKPGGRVLILDISPGRAYAKVLRAAGLVDVAVGIDNVAFFIPTWRITATKPAGT